MDTMDDDSIDTAANTRAAERIGAAPLPTGATLRMRQNLVVQLWRFVRFDLKMMRIILRGHG